MSRWNRQGVLRRAAWFGLLATASLSLAACSFAKPEVVAGGPTTVTFKYSSDTPPYDAAARYCAARGRKAVYRGGISVGQLVGDNMYAFDCVPATQ